jgi:hypothetical protein
VVHFVAAVVVGVVTEVELAGVEAVVQKQIDYYWTW